VRRSDPLNVNGSDQNGTSIRLNKTGSFRKVGVKVGPSGDPFLGLALGPWALPTCQNHEEHENRGILAPRYWCRLLRAGPSRLSPWPHPSLAVGTP
jgi:hypothetical protein